MLTKTASDWQILEALDGPKAVAAHLKYSEHAVKKWGEQGIPWRYRPRIKAVAEKKRVKLPPDFLSERRIEPRRKREG